MAEESEMLQIQRELLRSSIQQEVYLRLILRQQAEAIARMQNHPEPEVEAAKAESQAHRDGVAEMQQIGVHSGLMWLAKP